MKFLTCLLSCCFLLLTAEQSLAQVEALVTDRPTQSESSSIVLQSSLQIESGLRFGTDKELLRTNRLDIESLFRYGLLKNMELRLLLGYRSVNVSGIPGGSVRGLTPVTVGTKIAITEERGILPEMAFSGHLNLSYFGTPEFRPEDVEPSFRFSFTHTLSEKISLGYNLGMEWEGAEEAGIYTLVLGIGLTDRLSIYIEQFGALLGDFNLEGSANGGLTYLLSNNFQIDLTGGLGLTNHEEDAFVSVGLSWRLPPKND